MARPLAQKNTHASKNGATERVGSATDKDRKRHKRKSKAPRAVDRLADNDRLRMRSLLDFAKIGAKFVPVASADKRPIGGYSSRKWLKGVEDAEQLWHRFPGCNYGIVTGAESGVFVLDVDGDEGAKSLAALKKANGKLPKTVRVETGKGFHLYFKCESEIPTSTGTLAKGIDVRGGGALAVGPGSIHENGAVYRYAEGRSLHEVKLRKAPDWLLGLITRAAAKPVDARAKPISEGSRNTELTKLAGKLVRSGLPSEAVEAALHAYNASKCSPPLENDEVARIAESVSRYPHDISDLDPAEVVADIVLKQHFSGGEIILRAEDGQFWSYSGKMWLPLPEESLRNTVLKTLNAHRELLRKSVATASLVRQTVEILRASTFRDGDPLRFKDATTNRINLENGELQINEDGTWSLHPHRPGSYLRHIVNIKYDPTASCPKFDKALNEIFSKSDDPGALVGYLYEFIGYAIQPRRPIPTIAIWHGSGRNGKSSIADILVSLLGSDQVAPMRIGELGRNQFSTNALFGKLLLLDDDVHSHTRLPDGELKKISELKLVSAERKNGPVYQFLNRAIPLLLCNNASSVADLSPGLRRRLFVLPFKREFAEAEIDRKLFDEIKATELSGVLNHALRGLKRVIQRGWRFDPPRSMLAAQSKFLAEANPLHDFLNAYCKRKGDYLFADLYRHFQQWCEAEGLTHVKQKRLVKRDLVSLCYNIVRRRDGDTVIGLSPRDT